MMYFRDAEFNEIIEAWRVMYQSQTAPPPERYYFDVEKALGDIRRAVRGGIGCREFLLQKVNETPNEWKSRQEHFVNVRFASIIVDRKADLLYGKPPERHLTFVDDDDSEASKLLDNAFGTLYEDASSSTLFRRMVAPSIVRDEWCSVKVWHDATLGMLRLSHLPRECTAYIVDPRDAMTYLGVIEIRKFGKSTFERTLWTTKGYALIDRDWSIIDGDGFEPLPVARQVPFIRFGLGHCDFGNPMEDAVLVQKDLINLDSQISTGVRAQTFSQLVVSGKVSTGSRFKSPVDGKERLFISPESVIEMEEGGKFEYATPNYPLDPLVERFNLKLKQGLETFAVPAFSIDTAGSPEQPMALAIKMLPSLSDRLEALNPIIDSEKHLAEVVSAYGAQYNLLPLSTDDLDLVHFEVKFPENVTPADKAIERSADAADVAAGLMTKQMYVRKWHMPDASDDDVAEELAKLAEQDLQRTRAVASIFTPRPTSAPAPGAGSNGNAQGVAERILAEREKFMEAPS
jgi:hypothetical protein